MTITRTIEGKEVEISLTPEELRLAYNECQHEFDKQDILNHFDCFFDPDYEWPSADEVEAAANELRRILDSDADACWTAACDEAVIFILKKRGVYEGKR